MMRYELILVVTIFILATYSEPRCQPPQTLTFVKWSGMTPDQIIPVFVYSASGDEESLTGACLARCRELDDCAAVIVAYTKGNCQGIAKIHLTQFSTDNEVAYFNKVCIKLPDNCDNSWWALESTPGYYLNTDGPVMKVITNTTVQECYNAIFSTNEKLYRSSQWVYPDSASDTFTLSDSMVGNCILNGENKFTEPESYRVSNYYTIYIENQCGHDYPKKIDRCSYEEYYNQTIKHVDLTAKNYTKDECKIACEREKRFVCRGFTWTTASSRGLCDLHSEDLVTTGSWLLRRVTGAIYYRRVICLNISVECEGSHLVVTYRPRGAFRGRVYVPGHGERCGARALGAAPVRLALPLHGDCDVNFAYAITKGPNGVVNRTMAYVMLMIQSNPIIQTAGDRWVRAGCSPGAGAQGYAKVDTTVAVKDSGRPSLGSESPAEEGAARGASAVFGGGGAPVALYAVRARAAGGAVALGEPLELRVETTDEQEIEAYNLVASSRLGDSSILLLDNRGCPTGQVDFPSFTRSYVGGTQRLSAQFKAFRFPTSQVVRFSIMVRFCEGKCPAVNCGRMEQLRNARDANDTSDTIDAQVSETGRQEFIEDDNWRQWAADVVARGGELQCGAGRVPLQMELRVGAQLGADTPVRADQRAALPEETRVQDSSMVCVHELLLVALALAWLAVQLLLLLGCCVLVKRYRNLAEMNMQKDYHSFDNVGFDTGSTHRRVHWPDQNIDIIHAS
ncbi:unnamed protein product [Euphydryas editha]|uniref:Uncharacterized protein n=1 Tax=Euphydryas editha TaxID=104508 RepID=A0AAU9VA26_EUPED|nr:unnamed protein product [Euphydryas editha]